MQIYSLEFCSATKYFGWFYPTWSLSHVLVKLFKINYDDSTIHISIYKKQKKENGLYLAKKTLWWLHIIFRAQIYFWESILLSLRVSYCLNISSFTFRAKYLLQLINHNYYLVQHIIKDNLKKIIKPINIYKGKWIELSTYQKKKKNMFNKCVKLKPVFRLNDKAQT